MRKYKVLGVLIVLISFSFLVYVSIKVEEKRKKDDIQFGDKGNKIIVRYPVGEESSGTKKKSVPLGSKKNMTKGGAEYRVGELINCLRIGSRFCVRQLLNEESRLKDDCGLLNLSSLDWSGWRIRYQNLSTSGSKGFCILIFKSRFTGREEDLSLTLVYERGDWYFNSE